MRRSGTPVNAVIFMVTIAFLLGLPLLKSVVAFQAVVSLTDPHRPPFKSTNKLDRHAIWDTEGGAELIGTMPY